MPHISRQFLKGAAEQELVQEMLDTLSVKGSPARRKKVARELLTGVERLMLAKRLAVVCMLGEGVAFEEIARKLKVSPSTVSRLWRQVQGGKFKETLQSIQKDKTNARLLALIEALVMPRSRNAARWKFIDEL
ncbi:MAG: Trp family transcriptional regulator [Candidatus Adlerbacteria bacterium]|nr:Trp family transcriptional regulator [Candidatus Adlerbacteria bacterium]